MAAAIIGGAATATFGFLLWRAARDPRLPRVEALAAYTNLSSTRVLDRGGLLIGEVGSARHAPVAFARMAPALVQAALVDEPEFLGGSGPDRRSLWGAFTATLRLFGPPPAPAGLTQAVARRAFAEPSASFRRRLQELALVWQLGRRLPRTQLVELYLNYGHHGERQFGCEAAAQHLFGIPAARLDAGQAALLVALGRTGGEVNPRKQPHLAQKLKCALLEGMARARSLDAAAAHALCIQPLAFGRPAQARLNYAPEVTDSVTTRLVAAHGRDKLDTLGLVARTAIDLPLQTAAWETIGAELEALDARLGLIRRSGHLTGAALARTRAELGQRFGRGLPANQAFEAVVDRVERDPTRPRAGRLFLDVGAGTGLVDLADEPRYTGGERPFIESIRPGDLLPVRWAPERVAAGEGDAPAELPLALALGPEAALVVLEVATREVRVLVGGYRHQPGTPSRAQRPRPPGATLAPFVYAAALESRRRTLLDLRRPFIEALEPHAVRLAAQVKAADTRELAARAGVLSPLPPGAAPPESVAAQVTPLELANVYATLAAGGVPGVPSVMPASPTSGRPLVRPATAYMMTSLLASVVARGPAARVAASFPREIAALPALTADGKDAWFVGFTPDLVAVSWVGFDDGRALGSRGSRPNPAEEIWLAVMQRALADRPARSFPRPATLVTASLDPRSGKRLERDSPGRDSPVIEELFLPGTEPRFQPEPDEGDAAPASGVASPEGALLGHPWARR